MPDNDRGYETPSEAEMEVLNRAKGAAFDGLLKIPGVHKVGIGYKRRGGQVTEELAVMVYVDHKLPRDDVSPEWMVPPEIRVFGPSGRDEDVVPTDVIERPRAVNYPHLPNNSLAGRVRPVPGGRSIQGPNGGTLGGWVYDDLNDETVLLSNNHVLGGVVGGNVYQPWSSVAPADQIADIVRTGTLDATIAAPTDPAMVSYEIEGVGPAVYETTAAVLNMPVEKSGAKTEHTTGRVVAIGISGHYGSTNDFEVDPDAGQSRFAYYGDSGSLIVERTNPSDAGWKRVVGLLWGGDPALGNAYGHQIDDVFADLDLTTVCAGVLAELFDSMFARTFAAPVGNLGRPIDVLELPAERERVAVGRGDLRLDEPRRRRWSLRPRERGLARDLEEQIVRGKRGRHLSELIHRSRADLVRIAATPRHRRVFNAAAAPFLDGLWSADEVLVRQATEEDVARFRRALGSVERVRGLEELLEEAGKILEELPGRSLGDVLR